ncbi:FAD binding domain-containing protein [Methylobacterium oryzisoli]|uniref:FAD binding domain-containing protein n=1 Tax=Methylobacterium oryzisoli TaxID=3385502 RepID=UPI0038916B96
MQPFTYVKPSTVPEAVLAVAAGGPSTRFIAGGTSLYDLMKLNVEAPTRVVDITGLKELHSFDTSGSRELVFGALARMSDVAEDGRIKRDFPALAESLSKAASQQLRNMASVGGNLLQRTRCPYFRHGEPFACNKRAPGSGCAAQEGLNRGHALLGGSQACIAVYPGDWAIALAAFDAEVDVIGQHGQRTVALNGLHVEPRDTPQVETVLAPDELITRIRVPVSRLGRASTYHKIRDRESYAFALTSAAVALRLDGQTVREARIALGGVATKPWRAREAERTLVGRPLTAEAAKAAGEVAFRGARSTEHNRFRIELGARTVADALMIARQRV